MRDQSEVIQQIIASVQASHHRNHPTISVSTLEGSQIYIFSLNT